MPWCPKCKCEYREGIQECADCKMPLVDTLPVEDTSEAMPDEVREAMLRAMSENIAEEEVQENQQSVEPVRVYQNKKAKAEDFKSSAYTLLVVGVLGLLALVLLELGVFPVRLAAPGKYVTYGVMGALFVIFIVTGIFSFISSKKYAQDAKTEEELSQQIRDWTLQNMTKTVICEKANVSEDMPEEMKYFKYFEILNLAIKEQFGELDASYLDTICEELYGIIFEEN